MVPAPKCLAGPVMNLPEHQRPTLAVRHDDMANAIRALTMDAVEAANSGHPGMPMGMADAATVLFTRFLRFDPAWPEWPDRDRFVLSAGHGSLLLYALLYLTGYEDITVEEIARFRQLGSRTAGHPEYGAARGIETTTGPLGQGLANAVGMAIAERHLAARFGSGLVDHTTYAIAGDGCLMEGISHEAISLAGHLGLGRLIVLFDDNQVTIDGPASLSTGDDALARFAASGWSAARVDGHDPEAVATAIAAAREEPRPSLIACRTTIGYGAPGKEGTAAVHGAPLGGDEIAAARTRLGWPHPPFTVPEDILGEWRAAGARGGPEAGRWKARLEAAEDAQRTAFSSAIAGALPDGFARALDAHKKALAAERPAWATRKASHVALGVINAIVPEIIGGSADLTGSNNTKTADMTVLRAGDYGGRYIHFGVREHAMAAVMNGLALHGGVIPYGGTFLVFSDYLRPALRLSALMGVRVIYVLSHDSIGLGEDGPTHQPIEHLAALRAIPGLFVMRPADAIETVECWAQALGRRDGPSAIALTRQGVPAVRLEHREENLCARGAYELAAAEGAARVSLFATGSEVGVALQAKAILDAEGAACRVVSAPCWELFALQDQGYRARTVAADTVRVAVEAASPFGWERFVGADGAVIGMNGFGASAPGSEVFSHFGITAEAVAAAARERL